MNQSYTKLLKVANFKDRSRDIVEFLSIDNQVLNQKAINSIVVIENFINFAFGICHAESPERGNKRVGAGLHLWSVY